VAASGNRGTIDADRCHISRSQLQGANMRTSFALVLGILFAASGSGRAEDKKDDKKDDNATAIVGLWEITKAGGDVGAGSTLQFAKDGKVVLVVKSDDGDVKREGTYKIEKDKLTVTLKAGDDDFDQVLTIKKLKDDDMELEDKDGGIDVLKRKKKKD
jgi:uncharacterized protein (TIGR03066 family)